MKKKNLLVFAEYIFLGLSALGTILVTVSGQVGLAVVPITLTLLINLINRKSLTQLSQKTKKNENILLEDNIKYMESRINHLEKLLSITVERDEFEQKLHEISQATAIQTKSSEDEAVKHLKNMMESRINHLEKLLSITVERDEFEQKLHEISQATAIQTKSSRDETVKHLKNIEGLIHRFENTSNLYRAETPAITVNSFVPPKVESKYRKESFSHNSSANSRAENNSKSNTIPPKVENEMERGIHEIGKGIQEIGESIFKNFSN